MSYHIRNKKTIQIQPGSEVGGHRIIWVSKFYDKEGGSIGLYIGIDKKSYFRLFISDSSNVLSKINKKSKDIKKLILESLEITKKNCRLIHPDFDRSDTILPEGRHKRKG